MTSESNFVMRLIDRAPELRSNLDRHLADEDGELMPYLFMGEVAEWLSATSAQRQARACDVLAWLEAEYVGGDFEVRNLIDVGIVEMLPAAPGGDPVLNLLPEHLRQRASVAGLLDPPESQA